MKIVIAPDSFKGSCSSIGVANAIERGIKKVVKDAICYKVPIADGGEGTVEAILIGAGGKKYYKEVTDPMGGKVNALYGILEDGTAVIEMAAASGLPLVPKEKRNPMIATTYGTGELIKEVIKQGCTNIVLGIGGSATNDAGLGCAQALGISYKDKDGNELGFGGGELSKLDRIDLSGLLPELKEGKVKITVAVDVTNPMCGEKGASNIFGRQKGATEEMVWELDSCLHRFGDVVKEQFGKDLFELSGGGAAGGLGLPLVAFCGAEFKKGVDMVLDVTNSDKLFAEASLVFTGEGQIDYQSVLGKVPVGVGQRAKKYNLPVIAIVGGMGKNAQAVYEYGVDSIMPIPQGICELQYSMEHAEELLEDAAERAMRMLVINLKQ